eukprot:TRINITY_DN5781_c0_g1_i1.p1 TRINITY_DN5781_c0_g1~~TRINITY_DN5781_c0_g1_i1.p1  ORF type:complete len:202 (+),score=1.38 TRINITY_DN5781_c0_g1_i1:285-890(+)
MAYILLKENYSIYNSISAACGILGVILIFQPPFIFQYITSEQVEFSLTVVLGRILALIQSFILASIYTLMRYLKHMNPLTLIHYQVIGGSIFGPFGMIFHFDSTNLIIPGINDLLLIAISGIVEATLLYFIAKSLQYEKAGKIAIFNYTQIVFAYVIDIILFNQSLSILSISGSCLIFVSSIIVYCKESSISSEPQKTLEF